MPLPRSAPRDLAVGGGIGVFSGLMGVGGGILLVPYLVLRRGFAQKPAQATSLVMVATASLGGAVTYAINGKVAWLPALLIAVGGLAGVWLGAHTVQRTADHRLQLISGIALVLVAIRLATTASSSEAVAASDPDQLPSLTALVVTGYVLSGVGMGFLSALLGIGGGILIIPVLATVFDYEQQLANGTSLAVMIPIALLGAYRLSRAGLTDWNLGLRFGAGAVAGGALGALIAVAMSGIAVRYAFSVVMIVIGVRMTQVAWRARRQKPGTS